MNSEVVKTVQALMQTARELKDQRDARPTEDQWDRLRTLCEESVATSNKALQMLEVATERAELAEAGLAAMKAGEARVQEGANWREQKMRTLEDTNDRLVGIVRDALSCFNITQSHATYPADFWSERAKAELQGQVDANHSTIAQLQADNARLAADLEICMEALEQLSPGRTFGAALFSNLCAAGRNEVSLRMEYADEQKRRTSTWQDAEAAAGVRVNASASGPVCFECHGIRDDECIACRAERIEAAAGEKGSGA